MSSRIWQYAEPSVLFPLCHKKKATSLTTSEPLPRKVVVELLMIDLSRAKSKTRTTPKIPARRDDKKV
jgi:hypothetical protein